RTSSDCGSRSRTRPTTDALISGVAARTTHKLIARASVARFPAGAARDLGVVIRQLGVQRVVVAALTREGPSLALSLELLDGEQTHLWSRRLLRPVAELEQLCDDAARAIAGEVGASRAVASTSRDPAAYRAYLSGRFFWAKRDHASVLTAIEYFQKATELEPGYAQAWVGLADSYLLLPWMGPTPRSAAHRKAQEALGRALLLDPDSPEAHASRGNQLLEIEWSFLAAEAAFRRALELDPNNATAHQWLAELLMLFRRFDEADAEMLLALELEPLNAAVHKDRGKVLYYAGRYADSEAASRKAIELDPGQPWARQSLGYALGAQGRYDEALAALRAEPRWQLSAMAPFVAVQELWVASQRGDRAEATRAAEVVERARLEQFAPWTVAFVAAVKGDVDAMLRALDQALIQRDPFMPFTAVNREFDPYRADPRFMAIMTRAGLWPWR
ncbi:MAG TPA: tetratricopeptide repeat protein, partial [Kofleriaceae bacterium]|nr:tetratricopeptide repeat protein [Kofleriaceae bacterium]